MDNNPLSSQPIMDENIEIIYFDLPSRIVNTLYRNNIITTEDLEKIPDEQTLFNFKGIGQKALRDIKKEYKRIFQKELFNNKTQDKTKLRVIPIQESQNKRKRKRILEAKRLYEEFGTLQKVANILRLTRERVRQLLKKGEKFGLFIHQTTRTTRFIQLTKKVSKENLIKEIESNKTVFEVCTLFGIGTNQYFKLVNFYNIDTMDHRLDAKRRKYIAKYMTIVDFLGHHPSTTELNSKPEWRNIWHCIDRCWGGIEKFRAEYGIEKPPMTIHPNTLRAWKEHIIRKQFEKQEKMNKIIALLKTLRAVNRSMIIKTFGYSYAMTVNYMEELFNKHLIKKRRVGRIIFYSLAD